MTSDTLVKLVISDGYSFISGIAMASDLVGQANLRCTPTTISLLKEGKVGNTRVLFNLNIDPKKLLSYNYNAVDEKGNPLDEILVGIDMGTFSSRLKSIKRKSTVTLIIKAGEDKLYVHTGEQNEGTFIFDMPFVDEIAFDVENYFKNNTICRLTPEEFSVAMTKIKNGKCKVIKMIGYKEGVHLQGYDSSEKATIVDNFGFVEEKYIKKGRFVIKGVDDLKVSFSGDVAKTLAKIVKVAGRAVVSINIFTVKDDILLTLSTQYGTFGTYDILILEKK
jgi:hypothetical protein